MAETAPERTPLKEGVALLVALVVTAVAALVGSVATATSVGTWYPQLAKPAWTPSAGLFGPIWIILYVLMAVSVWQVWRSGDRATVRGPLFVYGIQLALNALWPLLFFGLNRVGLALVTIIVLIGAVAWTFAEFRRVDPYAAWLLLPYLGWLLYAMALNAAIWWLNH